MPLFGGNKFTPKKAPARQQNSLSLARNLDEKTQKQEFGIDYGPVSMKLGGQQFSFIDGNWLHESQAAAFTENSTSAQREVLKLKQQNQKLLEENNLLKLKVDILLDLVAQTSAEHNLQEQEIEELRASQRAIARK